MNCVLILICIVTSSNLLYAECVLPSSPENPSIHLSFRMEGDMSSRDLNKSSWHWITFLGKPWPGWLRILPDTCKPGWNLKAFAVDIHCCPELIREPCCSDLSFPHKNVMILSQKTELQEWKMTLRCFICGNPFQRCYKMISVLKWGLSRRFAKKQTWNHNSSVSLHRTDLLCVTTIAWSFHEKVCRSYILCFAVAHCNNKSAASTFWQPLNPTDTAILFLTNMHNSHASDADSMGYKQADDSKESNELLQSRGPIINTCPPPTSVLKVRSLRRRGVEFQPGRWKRI